MEKQSVGNRGKADRAGRKQGDGPGSALRVLLVANTLPPRDISGVGEQVLQLAEGLRERGHEVEIRGRGAGGPAARSSSFRSVVLPGLLADLRRFRPHVVQVHESTARSPRC